MEGRSTEYSNLPSDRHLLMSLRNETSNGYQKLAECAGTIITDNIPFARIQA